MTTPGYFIHKFRGKCYIFHQSGHKAHECPSKKKNNEVGGYKGGRSGGGFKVTCSGCGKYGHNKENCWEDDRNNSKRSDGYKKAGDRNLATTEEAGDNDEVKG